jgi:F-type H+-transporting ATPase subunit alpha
VCIIYAVTHGYLNSIDVEQIPEFEQRLYEFMDNRYETVLETIRSTGKLEKDTEETLQTAITELLAEFGKNV